MWPMERKHGAAKGDSAATVRSLCKSLILLSLPSLILTFVVLEVVFRLLIPASEEPYAYYDSRYHIMRFDTDGPRNGLKTAGFLAQQKNRWMLNEQGWVSSVSYEKGCHTPPLVAIIGDSYIQSVDGVDTDKSIAARLRVLSHGRFRVYSFGVSGMALPSYLHMARYVSSVYCPDIMVVAVVHNDFAESLCSHKVTPGGICLKISAAGVSEMGPTPYHPSRFNRILRKSALVRFLWSNLNGTHSVFAYLAGHQRSYASNVDVGKVMTKHEAIRKAVAYVVRQFSRDFGDTEIIFMLDAPRPQIYSGSKPNKEIIWMHETLSDACRKYGVLLLDLTECLSSNYKLHGEKFETKWDDHWNEVGHSAVAECLDRVIEQRICK